MKKFTLVELLVVVEIIGILASILLPSLQEARSKSKVVVCVNNIKQQYLGMYTQLEGSDLPIYYNASGDHPTEDTKIYNGNEDNIEILFCPLGSFESESHNASGYNSSEYIYVNDPELKLRPTGNDKSKNYMTIDLPPDYFLSGFKSEYTHMNLGKEDGSVKSNKSNYNAILLDLYSNIPSWATK